MEGRTGWAVLALALAAAPARAGGAPAVQVGNHPGFGRVVFGFPGRIGFQAEAEGSRVRIRFEDGSVAPAAQELPRNVLSMSGRDGVTEIVMAPGARMRSARVGNRVVIDVLDPPGGRPAPRQASAPPAAHAARTEQAPLTPAPSPTPAAAPGVPVQPERAPADRSRPEPAPEAAAVPPPATPPPAAGPAPVAGPMAAGPMAAGPMAAGPMAAGPMAAGPMAIAARPLPPPASGGGAVLVPFGPGVGAAAFRQGDTGVVVFDERRPLDLGPLRDDPVFAGASVQLLPAGTVLRLKLPRDAVLRLSRQAEGWQIAVPSHPAPAPPLSPRASPAGLALDVDGPGRVVVLPDSESGQALLVGTLNPAGGGGGGLAATRRTPEFVLGATWQGVVVEALSDRLQLRPTGTGFLLSSAGAGLVMSDPAAGTALADAASLTRRFDFPALPTDALLRRMQAQVAAAAAAPARARGRERVAAAQSMIALGLGAEAQALLLHAAAEDPQAAETPEFGGLAAVAALLAGRVAEADGLDDPRLSGTDEVALWRAVRDAARREDAPAAAGAMAAAAPLVLSYPAALRARLLPLVAETMALGGAGAGADALLKAVPDDPSLSLARGLRLEASGDADGALRVYDALAAGRDRLARARAAGRAVELRLASGALTPEAAADAMARLIQAWRGDAREYAVRLRAAELRARAGGWRPAFDLLRETDAAFPDDRAKTRERMAELLTAMLGGGDRVRIAPLDLVALTQEYAELIPEGASGDAAAALLADKLVALDLPRRAGPVLDRLMRAAAPGPARAGVGVRLAGMRLEEGDAAGAAAALTASDPPSNAPELPAELRESRALTLARARASLGDLAGATAVLASAATPAADELRAALLSQAADWPGAAAALADLAAKTIPAQGALTEAQQSVLIRQASAAAQAGDAAALRALRAKEGARVASGPKGELFRLLTTEPVRGVGDLPRAAAELALARALPGQVQALPPRGP